MAITAPIPQPQYGIDAFMSGAANAQGIFDSMVANRVRKQQIASSQQQMKQAEQMNPLDIQYKQAQIKNILSQAAQRKADAEFANMINGNGSNPPNNPDQNTLLPPPTQQTAQPSPPMQPTPPVVNQPNISNQDVNNIADLRPGGSVAVGTMAQPPAGQPAMMHGVPTSAFQQDQVMATPQGNSAPPMNAPAMGQSNNAPKLPTEIGQQTEISPSTRNPLIDRFAGQSIHGIHVPAAKDEPISNGYQVTRWTSGRVTVRKVGQTDQEKLDAKEESTEKRIQKNSDVKAAQKSLDNGKELLDTANDYKDLYALNEKNITGVIAGKQAKWGISTNEDLGKFNSLATRAQGKLARLLASRPGAVALQIAAPGKPNAGSQMEYNRGLITGGIDTIKQEFENEKSAYEQATGKPYPIKLPDLTIPKKVSTEKTETTKSTKSPDDMVSVRDRQTGAIHKMKRSEAEKLMATVS